jgi:hypothetical protein
MVDIVPITASRHSGKAWRRPGNLAFASELSVAELIGGEFAAAVLALPIGFIQQGGSYLPVAVMSPVAGRNLFVGPDGQWLGAYLPATLRAYPFRLGRVADSDNVSLCIDEDSLLVVDADGVAESFVDTEGNPTPATKEILNFLMEMERSRKATEIAVAALSNAGVIQPWKFQVTIGEQATPAAGLFRVDEVALNALDGTAFL